MRLFVLPYKSGSASANVLATGLSARRIKLKNSRYSHREGDVIINWGNSTTDLPCINSGPAVATASNKLSAFEALAGFGVEIPDYTTDKQVAAEWAKSGTVVVRSVLSGHSGRGITITEDADNIPDAPLYTKYIKKRHEYRVHVVDGEVIDTQQKRRRTDTPDDEVDWQVRNYDNGFIYAREDVQPCSVRDSIAIAAVAALDLDFGAVDIIYNAHRDQYYVLEVNTAPGLTGTTLSNYILKLGQML